MYNATFLERTGIVIRTHREAKGMTQQELAERAGWRKRHISQIEKGNMNFFLTSFRTLCGALDLELNEVFRPVESPISLAELGKRLQEV